MGGIGSHTKPYRGATNNWISPPEFIADLGPFDLDPCGCVPQPWPTAETIWCENGLLRRWFGRVWMNPPYGPDLGTWLRRLSEHGNGIAVTFARTETRAFFEWVWPVASGLRFLKGRPHFYRPDGSRATGNSGGPVVLIAYGEAMASRLEASRLPGAYVRLP